MVTWEKHGRADSRHARQTRRIVIMGAAGRDFHNFNMVYRNDPSTEVAAFTAAQIPEIADRTYPPALAGKLYPSGIPVHDEARLAELIARHEIDEVVFSYSDVSHCDVMHKASTVLAAGANFSMLGPQATMLKSCRPVISVCAVRTGVGKSQVSRWLSARLRKAGMRVAVIRHPMPYGDLAAQAVQRYETLTDLSANRCTIEEREEYEPHIAAGSIVFAGVDYAHILEQAERDADIIVWDGGNNDFSFLQPDLSIALVDAMRPDQIASHHPGETVLRMADVVIVAKTNAAAPAAVAELQRRVKDYAPKALCIRAASVTSLEIEGLLTGKRVLVVEDGPTLTHGGMATGAGFAAAMKERPAEIIDPRAFAVGQIAETYKSYPHIGPVLPALGYSEAQLRDLERTINASQAEVVVAGTPIDLASLMWLNMQVVRARYEFEELDSPGLGEIVDEFTSVHAPHA